TFCSRIAGPYPTRSRSPCSKQLCLICRGDGCQVPLKPIKSPCCGSITGIGPCDSHSRYILVIMLGILEVVGLCQYNGKVFCIPVQSGGRAKPDIFYGSLECREICGTG